MAFDTFTAILNAATFPFFSDFFQRSIIVPGIDNPVRTPKDFYGTSESANFELAQGFYIQNVMPFAEGLASVSYEQELAPMGGVTDFDEVVTVRDPDENNFIFVPARGQNYLFNKSIGAWQSLSPFGGWTGSIISRSYVNGRTFICYEKNSIWEYDQATNLLNSVSFTGINISDIDCIGASNNYNIAVTGITVNWSSLVDPTDFTPNIQTGAGSAIPQDMKGIGRAVIPISGGFVIYTTKNAVIALYTNNARAPFVFKEIPNAGGVTGPEMISTESGLGVHYAWTTSGLQKITVNGAESLSAAATDFLAGKIWEEFNTTTKELVWEYIDDNMDVKLTYVSGRYLCISYGKQVAPKSYTHVLVYDTSLKRWGKLRKDHVDCFPYPYPNYVGLLTDAPPKQSVAFLLNTGQVDLLVMDFRERRDDGVLLLGRYQLIRHKLITFQNLTLEGLHNAYPADVFLYLSQDGRTNQSPSQLQLVRNNGSVRQFGAPLPFASGYAGARTGINFSVGIIGTFELTTAVFEITRHGSR